MTRSFSILGLSLAGFFACCAALLADDGRPGSVTMSDGQQLTGALSLTSGKQLRLFVGDKQVSLQLDQLREMRFKVEKEEMAEGFYFPTAGQATKAKTGEIYPVRYLQTTVMLADGNVLEGHLFTTTLFVENDTGTQKVVLMAKLSGSNGQKLDDVVYPTLIHFDGGVATAGSSQIDLTRAGMTSGHDLVVVARPDLSVLPVRQVEGKQLWTVPVGDPATLMFTINATDGLHVAWPEPEAEPEVTTAVQASLKTMEDFYDTRTLLGCFADTDAGDVYSLVMLERKGVTYEMSTDKTPWSLVILRWKYDPDAKKTTLLNRVRLAGGRFNGNSGSPAVFKSAALLMNITANPVQPAEGPHP